MKVVKGIQTGLSMVNDVVNLGKSLGIGRDADDRRQMNQQKRLNQMGLQNSKEMANYNYMLNKKMWDETNYEAQVQKMKEAGLNPAMLYGMGGEGGSLGGSNMDAGHGGTAANAAQTAMAERGLGMQSGMQDAQIKMMEAQARKLNADADKSQGVDTEAVRQTIENMQKSNELMSKQIDAINDETKNNEVRRAGWALDNAMKEMQNALEEEKGSLNIDMLKIQIKLAGENLKKIEQDNQITKENKDLIKQQIKLQLLDLQSGIIARETGVKLTNEQIMKSRSGTALDWAKLNETIRHNKSVESAGGWQKALGRPAQGMVNWLSKIDKWATESIGYEWMEW